MASHGKRGRPPHADLLTPAEWRVVEAVRHGMSNREIAARRGISTDGVKYHVANALQKLGFSSRAELRQWNGVARGTKLHLTGDRMDGKTEIGAIGQIARHVTDIDAARHWYKDVLGLEHLYSFGDLAFFACGDVRLFLSPGDNGGGGDSIIYFRVDDIRSAHSDLTARGITFVSAPHMIHRHEDGTEEWMAFFHDNEGRPLGLMAQVKA